MTDKDVMERFIDVVGYGKLLGPYKTNGTKHKSHYKNRWEWSCQKSSEVLRLLKLFLPHFGKRRSEKAIEAINHLNEIIN